MPVLILAFPLLSHLAALWQRTELQALALICLVAIPLYPPLRAGQWRSWALFLLSSAVLILITALGGAALLLKLPPIVLPFVIGWTFARTLRTDTVPLVTRIARAERSGILPDELVTYTRAVTLLWALTLLGLSLLSLLLALFAPIEIWSWFTNVFNYAVLAALFPLEYLWRRWRYRHLQHPGLIAHLRGVATLNYRQL